MLHYDTDATLLTVYATLMTTSHKRVNQEAHLVLAGLYEAPRTLQGLPEGRQVLQDDYELAEGQCRDHRSQGGIEHRSTWTPHHNTH